MAWSSWTARHWAGGSSGCGAISTLTNSFQSASRALLVSVVRLSRNSRTFKVRVHKLCDHHNRLNYGFVLRGKTGARDVIPVASLVPHVGRVLASKGEKHPNTWFFAMSSGSKMMSLADQFAKVLEVAERKTNSAVTASRSTACTITTR